jgi:hydroxymethylbilane synthase
VRRLRLGTRRSRLALVQAHAVARLLEAHEAGLSVEIVELSTSGDINKDVPLGPELGQAFFTKEIEDALLQGRVDLAVHSCKDLSTDLPEGLVIGAIPDREDPRDALVGPCRLMELPPGARVGTSSVRRKRFLAIARPDLEIVDLRGNVPTRVRAVDEGRCDAAVLAVAGLKRLGLEGRVTEVLEADVMLPAAGQGALAVEIPADDGRMAELARSIDDATARVEVTAERACLHRLEAGCQAPVGALGRARRGKLELRAAVVAPEGPVAVHLVGAPEEAEALGTRAAEELLAKLGLRSLRGATWAGGAPLRLEGP